MRRFCSRGLGRCRFGQALPTYGNRHLQYARRFCKLRRIRYSVNVSILFTEAPFLERFGLAAAAGFSAVEFWWPRGEELDEVAAAVRDASMTVALMNFDAGDMAAGDRGLVGEPDRTEAFREHVPVALELARTLRCSRLNALLGHRNSDLTEVEQLDLAIENLRFAADLAGEAEVLVEAVNTFENGPYLVSRTADAAALVRRVDRANVRLQYDAYHMQRMEGNLVATLREHIGQIAHVQIADSPDRHEPGTGEINYRYLLEALEQSPFDGYVGLEYKPRRSTDEALAWLPREQRSAA
jgi:hydroxypyruvate isomerase